MKLMKLSIHCCMLLLAIGCSQLVTAQPDGKPVFRWKVHDMSRPKPVVVTPADLPLPVPPPANAVVLFKGGDLSQWKGSGGAEAKWKMADDYVEVTPGTGGIETKENFGDVFLHVEWASPDEPNRTGQDRGNSGIFFMGRYELQVLDSYQADTYADGQAGALYGQTPPRFNACKPRGQWNSYDISFRRPRFSKDGKLQSPARITVIHNGILIQDNEVYWGPTSWLKFYPYVAHADKLPLGLQEHNCRVRYRNIWAIPLPEIMDAPADYNQAKPVAISSSALDKFIGTYDRSNTHAPIVVIKKDNKLFADFYYRKGFLELVPTGETGFAMKDTDGTLNFETKDGKVTGAVFSLGDDKIKTVKSK